ncbi:hypothetical protein KAR91_83645 [Candidatus Pacearchaeota archaeon]|nr:hypothetical protein [Candidatus Pacearchaeota archaeon]
MEGTKEKDDGIKVVGPNLSGMGIPEVPESTAPVSTKPEAAQAVGTEVETSEPESTGTEEAISSVPGTTKEPEGSTDEVPKILGEIKGQVKKLHDQYGYLQRKVEASTQAPVKPVEPEKPKPSEKPRPQEEDFEKYDDYIDALTDWKVDVKLDAQATQVKEKEISGETAEAEKAFKGKLDVAREKYSDFDDIALNINVPITEAIVDILHDTENPGEIAYYLGKNAKECRTIANMTPIQAVRAIDKIGAEIAKELAKNPPPVKTEKTVTAAPAPIKPIGSREIVTKDPAKMTQPEYEAWRKEQGES